MDPEFRVYCSDCHHTAERVNRIRLQGMTGRFNSLAIEAQGTPAQLPDLPKVAASFGARRASLGARKQCLPTCGLESQSPADVAAVDRAGLLAATRPHSGILPGALLAVQTNGTPATPARKLETPPLAHYPVSPRVNRGRSEGGDLIEPAL